MAALALAAKATIMHIVRSMAISAGGCRNQLLTPGWVLMAVIAGNTLVSAIQLESGLTLMIEIPDFPVTCVVTGFTLRTQAQFVHILLDMTTRAI